MVSQLPPSAKPNLGESKLQHVQRLINVLRIDLEEQNLTAPQKAATLERLKVYGRDPDQSDPIFTKEGIETLCKHGFDNTDSTISREALRCLANALLLMEKTRQIYVDLGYAEKAAEGFKSDSPDDEFLLARILLLITYETTVDLGKLLEEHKLGEFINQAISRSANKYSRIAEDVPPVPMAEIALSETLKLIFNIAHFVPSKASHFLVSIPNIFKILRRRELPSPPLQAPVTSLVNVLLSLDFASCASDVFPFQDSNCNVLRLVEILDLATEEGEQEFDDSGAPLLTLLRKMREVAPEHVKEYMKKRLLPSEEERDKPLGKSTTLASRLLNLTASAMTPNTREHISSLLFELSNSSPEEYVHNIGYGFASGFLMTRGLQVSPSTLSAASSGSSSQNPINPITGQTLGSEESVKDPLGDMTGEEKEREAEKLFVLFERHGPLSGSIRRLLKSVWTNAKTRGYRLKKTGVVDIKNPVQQALEEGRLENLD